MSPLGLALQLETLDPCGAIAAAQASGPGGILAADVLQPWVPSGSGENRAPFMWNILSAAGAVTTGPLGAVITPHFRHHPATIAHASATLAAMYPGRHWLALSAGEALNDAVTGHPWPRAPKRIDAMFEAGELIRRLFTNSVAGKDTRFEGEHSVIDSARLWTMPSQAPPLLAATAGPLTARRAGRELDGFITMGNDLKHAHTLMQRFEQGRKDAGKAMSDTLMVARLHVSHAPTIEQATSAALKDWPQAAMRFNTSDIRSPYDFAQIAKRIDPDDFDSRVLITTSKTQIVDLVNSYYDLGFTHVFLHNVGGYDPHWVHTYTQIAGSLQGALH